MQMKIYTSKFFFISFFIVASLIETIAMNQTTFTSTSTSTSNEAIKTIFKQLQTADQLVISTNLDSLLLNKKKGNYQAAQLTASTKGIEAINLPIKIKSRGKSRRNMCEMPPLKLNFNKTDLSNLGLQQSFDKIKLITHCQLDGAMENLLLKEYWTYRFYNNLSANSFRVKLIKITYVHDLDQTRSIDSYAVIIENSSEMAHRIGGTIVKQYGIQTSQLIPDDYHNLLVFNYMIGNTDWDVRFQQNVKLVKIEGQDQLIVVPYDFDQAKLVDAPYISVNKSLRTPRADNRYVMDQLNDPLVLANSIQQFKDLKDNGLQIHEDCPYLKKRDKKKMSGYLESFYALLQD